MNNYELMCELAQEALCETCDIEETCDRSTCTHPAMQREMDIFDMLRAGNMIICDDLQARSAFLYAVYDNAPTEIVKQLLECGADVNEKDEEGLTALMFATSHNATKSVELLLNAGAKINTRDIDGFTPLMYGIINGSLESVELLLKAGANPFRSNDNTTVLDLIRKRKPSVKTEQLLSLITQYQNKM
ncbi:MAG: ankyrin repeat domain-containing protein [Treponema sp.]|nr:ankyrin repeat domain-containing protein [Treponema sp.]